MIYGYCRVSTKCQLTGGGLEIQKSEILEKYPNAIIRKEQYTASTIDRPIFQKLITELKEGDILVVAKMDRFARTTEEGTKLMRELLEKGITVEILNFGGVHGGFNSANKLMFNILLAFAEYEKDCIIERMLAGKELARERLGSNYKEGMKPKFKNDQKELAVDLLEQGLTYREVEAKTGMSKSTLIRAKRERKLKNLDF